MLLAWDNPVRFDQSKCSSFWSRGDPRWSRWFKIQRNCPLTSFRCWNRKRASAHLRGGPAVNTRPGPAGKQPVGKPEETRLGPEHRRGHIQTERHAVMAACKSLTALFQLERFQPASWSTFLFKAVFTGDRQVPQRDVQQLLRETRHPVRVSSERRPVLHLLH